MGRQIAELMALDAATKAAWIAAIATVVVAIATVVNIAVSWVTSRIYRRMSQQVQEQIEIGNRQVDHTEQQLELVRRQSELAQKAFEAANKAHVFLELGRSLMVQPSPQLTYSTQIKLTNFGNAPAESLVARYELKCGPVGIGRIAPDVTGPITIVPRAEESISLSWRIEGAVIRPENQMMMFIRISFRDAGGEHKLGRAYEWNYDAGQFFLVREDDQA